jgi:basic amino acid/polyamine antiporter, APA family
MENVVLDVPTPRAESGSLLRILGVGFGLAVVVGGTIGVGILRNPGGVSEQIPSVWLAMAAWTLGGVYCLLGANYLSELATMTPKAGGFCVHAQRAFGDYGGFVVGWSDYLYNTLGLSFIAVVFGEYASALLTPDLSGGRVIFSGLVLLILTALNYTGVRSGAQTQKVTSALKAVALIAFVFVCFIYGGQSDTAIMSGTSSIAAPVGTFAQLTAFILAFQLVLGTYDGWHCTIYFTEEDTNPSQNLPRSMFGGIALIIVIYLLVNLALFYILPMSTLAGSKFAGGDAMTRVFGERGGQIVTVLALLSLIGIINALLMLCPRILLALGRTGMCVARTASVNKGGTPAFALIATAVTAAVFATIGSFELLLAISQFFAVTLAILLVIAMFTLRRREPDAPRPFKAWGYPYAPLLMLVCAVLLFFGYIVSNPYPSAYALGILAISYPVFLFIRKRVISLP